MQNRIVIVGASSAIAQHCARLWVEEGPRNVTLVVRDTSRAIAIADDLRARSQASVVDIVQADFQDPVAIGILVDGIAARGAIHTVLIAHGALPDQAACQNDLALAQHALYLNGISPLLFAEAFARHMPGTRDARLAIIGSVAGDRGRKSNYVYGAGKSMVDTYARGMQHRFAGSGLKVVLIKPGPTATPMTAHLVDMATRLAPVDDVARAIVRAIGQGRAVAYVPGKWRVIMTVIRCMPAIIFNRLNL